MIVEEDVRDLNARAQEAEEKLAQAIRTASTVPPAADALSSTMTDVEEATSLFRRLNKATLEFEAVCASHPNTVPLASPPDPRFETHEPAESFTTMRTDGSVRGKRQRDSPSSEANAAATAAASAVQKLRNLLNTIPFSDCVVRYGPHEFKVQVHSH